MDAEYRTMYAIRHAAKALTIQEISKRVSLDTEEIETAVISLIKSGKLVAVDIGSGGWSVPAFRQPLDNAMKPLDMELLKKDREYESQHGRLSRPKAKGGQAPVQGPAGSGGRVRKAGDAKTQEGDGILSQEGRQEGIALAFVPSQGI